MESRQVTKKTTFQLRLDIGWQKILLSARTETGRSMKELVEEVLGEHFGPIDSPSVGRKMIKKIYN